MSDLHKNQHEPWAAALPYLGPGALQDDVFRRVLLSSHTSLITSQYELSGFGFATSKTSMILVATSHHNVGTEVCQHSPSLPVLPTL
jgi:hypothetical protein